MSLPGFNIAEEKIDWSRMSVLHKSDDGARGVLFCQLEDRNIVVKNGSAAGSELFCYHLAQKLGIRMPFVRVVSAGDQ